MICLSSARFSMRATLLNPKYGFEDRANPDYSFNEGGQDPYTGEIQRDWIKQKDKPGTPDVNEASAQFPCLARGVQSNGIRAVGNTESFGEVYDNTEYVQMWFPAYVNLKKDDRVTEILDARGSYVYMNEEYRDEPVQTIFNVDGVQPIFDYANRHVENFALLSKVP